MKQKFTLFILAAVLFSFSGTAQTTWNGPDITFTKANNADWTMAANQDRITDKVWITRATMEGIFNIFSETEYADESSPADTEWALGTTADIGSLTFADWETTINSSPPLSLNKDMVLHLISENIYIDLKFTSWTTGNGNGGSGGGGFSYTRSTNPVSSIGDLEVNKVQLRPNPTSEFLYFDNLLNREEVVIYDLLGKEVMNARLSDNGSVAVNNLKNGVYLIKIDGFAVTKFIKI